MYHEQSADSAFIEDAADKETELTALTALTESHIQERIRLKAIQMLAASGEHSLNSANISVSFAGLSANFQKLSAEQQSAKIKDIIEKNTTYGSTLLKLKAFTLEKLNNPEIMGTTAEVQAAAMKVVEMAKSSDTKLFDLYFAIVKLCAVAMDRKGWFKSLAKPIQDLQDAIMGENGEYRLGNFLSHWEGDAQKLSIKEVKEEELTDELKVGRLISQAASEVYQEEYSRINITLNQTMERSRIYERHGQQVQLKDPGKDPSLSTVIAENLRVVKTQEIKTQKIKDGNKESIEAAVAKRLKQYMSDKAIYCIKSISELYDNIESVAKLLQSRVSSSQASQARGAGFFPSVPETVSTSAEHEFLNLETKKQSILRKIIYAIATSNNSEAIDGVLSKFLEQINAAGPKFELVTHALIKLQNEVANMADKNSVKNISEKWGFLATCYKVGSEYGCIFPCDREIAQLLSQAKAKKEIKAPSLPSSKTAGTNANVEDKQVKTRAPS